MNLAVFDLDGTLLDSNAADDRCFAAAWREEYGIDCANVDWSSFAHVTDSGIAEELFRRHGIDPSPEHVERVQRRFVERLTRETFPVIPGADLVVERLASIGWRSVIATGAWRASAQAKLGGRFAGVPLACCDGRPARVDIVKHAISLQPAETIVLFGDAPWDVETASRLSLAFIGVGPRAAGAQHVIPDFADFEAVAGALQRAAEMPRCGPLFKAVQSVRLPWRP